MTRQKKELIRRIDDIQNFIAADDALGCGFAPPDFYRGLEQEAWALEEQLARLRGYRDANAMLSGKEQKLNKTSDLC